MQGAGCLIVSLAVPGSRRASAAESRPLWRPLSPAQLDTYLRIGEDGSVTAFFGKMDMGQGVDISIAQIVAEELDVPLERVNVVMGDTALTVDQGGASGSTAIERGANPLRNAAAEARRVLVDLAAERFGADPNEVAVEDGGAYLRAEPARRAGYGELIGGAHFDVRLRWNGRYGNALDARGEAAPKAPGEYRVVGQPARRRDLPGIVMGDSRVHRRCKGRPT